MIPDQIAPFLEQAWSIRSSSKWTPENPAAGQCGPTALVVQDIFGGDILCTLVDRKRHFYNRIGGNRYDFTKTQFAFPPQYDDAICTRGLALTDCSDEQYIALKRSLEALLEAGAGRSNESTIRLPSS